MPPTEDHNRTRDRLPVRRYALEKALASFAGEPAPAHDITEWAEIFFDYLMDEDLKDED